MITHSGIQSFGVKSPVVTLGIFDGVHCGHQLLLSEVVKVAKQLGRESAVITFWPHPRFVLGKADDDFKLLNTLEEKTEAIRSSGIDHLIVIPFTPEFAEISGAQFISELLINKLHISCVVVGDDVRFGAGGKGSVQLLKEFAGESGFCVKHLDTHLRNETRISSTFIRACLRAGDLASANSLLGKPYSLSGTVTTGNRIGTGLGFPTANISVSEQFKQIPSDGVYAVYAEVKDRTYAGMLNIGVRPTLQDHDHKTIEVHMIGAEGDFYEETLTVRFIQRLRDEMKFGSLEELRLQLEEDRKATMNIITFDNI